VHLWIKQEREQVGLFGLFVHLWIKQTRMPHEPNAKTTNTMDMNTDTMVPCAEEFENIMSFETAPEVWNLKDIPEVLFLDFVACVTPNETEFSTRHYSQSVAQCYTNHCQHMRKDPVYHRATVEACIDVFMDSV
jgi:hypothetical protein